MGASFKKGRRHFYDILVREIEHRVYGKREVSVISRIIKVEVGVLSRRPWLFWISQKLNLIIVLLYIEQILSFSLQHKMFSKFVPTLSFPQVLSVFSLSRNQQTAPLPPSSTFLCFVSPCLKLIFDVLLGQRSKPGSQCFCFFTDGKQTQSARTWRDYP